MTSPPHLLGRHVRTQVKTGAVPTTLQERRFATSKRSDSQYLEQVTVRILEVETSATAAVVDFHIVRSERAAAISEPFLFYPSENCVEFGVADLERVVLPVE